MNTINNNTDIISPPKFTISQLLSLFGFTPFSTITFQFVIPSLALCGLVLCLLTAWIFFQSRKDFSIPFYDYYKLTTLINIIHLSMAIPYGFCFTPLYVPNTDGYKCRVFTIAYACLAQFFLYYTGVLEIAALLERMKTFSLFVKKYYTLAPKLICLIMLGVCVIIDLFYAFNYVTGVWFDYYDENGENVLGSFYVAAPSSVAQSPIGSKALIVLYFIRDFFTLIVGVILNIVSLIQLRAFLTNRSKRLGVHYIEASNLTSDLNVTTISSSQVTAPLRDVDKQVERNLLFMVVTLCSISIVSRLTLITTNTYFLFRNDGITLILVTLTDLVIVLGPCLSFFVFVFFNKLFRQHLRSILFVRRRR